jgi:hypothetical protein
VSDLEVVGQDVAPDPVAHLERVHVRIPGRVKRRYLVVAGRVRQVSRVKVAIPQRRGGYVATKTVLPAMALEPHR